MWGRMGWGVRGGRDLSHDRFGGQPAQVVRVREDDLPGDQLAGERAAPPRNQWVYRVLSTPSVFLQENVMVEGR